MATLPAYTLVTGAASGIGSSVAALLSRDRSLILHGRDHDRLAQARSSCVNPAAHLLWTCDFQQAAQVSPSLAAFLAEHAASVDSFVHCAGQAHVLAARATELNSVIESLNVNYVSAQQITATLLKKRINPGGLASIVFVSSIYSRVGVRGHGLYCASKAALDGLMRALAIELAPVTRVNSILPGAVKTRMSASALADPVIAQRIASDYPLGVGAPEDVAGVVAFLLSASARWITGQEVIVDGGRMINFDLK